VLTLPVTFAGTLTTDPLIVTATATDVASGATATGRDADTLVQAVALVVSKTAGSDTYSPGGQGTYTIVLRNTGTSDALGVSLVDALPAGVTLAGELTCTAVGNASCGLLNGAPGDATFGATGARLGGGDSALTFVARVAFAANLTADPLVNTATASDSVSGAVVSASQSSRPGEIVAVPTMSPAALAVLALALVLLGLAQAQRTRRSPG
jgi:uncharacterized repeat protein (TIGR01451 family)